jgi:cysteinyl-tRNA synthetase
VQPTAELPAAFTAAMDDDLNVPAAVAVAHEAVTIGNQALTAGDLDRVGGQLADVRAMLAVLGVDPLAEPWVGGGSVADAERTALDTLIGDLLRRRADARATKDFSTADAIRDSLAAAGIVVEDTAQGPRWHVADRR